MLPNDKLRITKAFLEVINEEITTSSYVYEKEPWYVIKQHAEKAHDILTVKTLERENAQKGIYGNIVGKHMVQSRYDDEN